MKTLPIVARALAFASVAALLVGCKTTTQSDIAAAVPHDYRQRHPIAVREGKQTLTVFIGDRRGGLNAIAARRGRRARRRPGGAMRPAASSSRCRTAARTSAPRWAPRARSARS